MDTFLALTAYNSFSSASLVFFDLSTQHIPFLFYLVTNCLSFLVAEGGWTGSPTIALDSEAKESITSFMNSNLDFGFLTVSLIKYKSSEATVTKG